MKNKSRDERRETSACGWHPVILPSTLDLLARRSRAKAARPSTLDTGFTLVEVLMAMVLLSLIVLALMAVFNSTQNAFRASLTQTDVLESGRLTMGLMTSDLEAMTPSLDTNFGTMNFSSAVITYLSPLSPLPQGLTANGQPNTPQRTNVLENFFSLSRQNISGSPSWVGTGYAVGANSPDGALYPLYRFYMTTNVADDPKRLFYYFTNWMAIGAYTNMSHLMDGVVGLTVRVYDMNGNWITNSFAAPSNPNVTNAWAYPPSAFALNEPSALYMYSNVVPAAVEVELGVLEDAILQRAEGFNGNGPAQQNYLSNHVGQVHVFRQRVVIRNVDPTAYQ